MNIIQELEKYCKEVLSGYDSVTVRLIKKDLIEIIEEYKATEQEPVAWLIPNVLDLTKARKVYFSRTPEGKDKTDDELKEEMNGTVTYRAEIFSDHTASDFVTDKHGNKHYYKPLFTHPQPSDETVNVPEGYAIVPINPDLNMLQAALDSSRKINPDTASGRPLQVGFEYASAKYIYTAMIDEAMKAKS